MQKTLGKVQEKITLKDIAVSVPKTMYSTNIFGKDIDTDKLCLANYTSNDFEITQMLTLQHPLINLWLIISLISICGLFMTLFFIN